MEYEDIEKQRIYLSLKNSTFCFIFFLLSMALLILSLATDFKELTFFSLGTSFGYFSVLVFNGLLYNYGSTTSTL